eukprot:5677990-Karenia_brevis.AAC.1
MDKCRAFTVPRPWFGIISAGHIPDLFRATQSDVFGLRERLTVVYGAPSWTRIKDIRAACRALPVPSGKPKDFLIALLYPLLRWSVNKQEGQ